MQVDIMNLVAKSKSAYIVWRRDGLRAVVGGLQRNLAMYHKSYERWVEAFDILSESDREAISARVGKLGYAPLISVIMVVPNRDAARRRKSVRSVCEQLYTNWELCIVDTSASKALTNLVLGSRREEADERIKIVRRQRATPVAACNTALALAGGEFVTLLDQGDELSPHALYMVVEELNDHPSGDVIYADEDSIGKNGRRHTPLFKPDWNPDLFRSYNFMSRPVFYRKTLVEQLSGFHSEYNESYEYDMSLRVIEKVADAQIRHVPHVLYHRRHALRTSTSTTKIAAQVGEQNALRSHLKRCGVTATVEAGYGHSHRVTYQMDASPTVSVVVGTRDGASLLRQTVEGVLNQTYHEQLELIIVDNQSAEPATQEYFDQVRKDSRVQVVKYDAVFNFSAINNFGVSRAKGDVVVLVNNDVKIISPCWLKEMISHAIRPEVGAVGAKLYYEDDRIQHAGIILGVQGGVAGHAHKYVSRQSSGYMNRTQLVQNLSAVTGACLAMRKNVFDEVGGLDEANLPVAYNDIDLCLRVRQRGYRIVWTPYAELYHLESATRGSDATRENLPRFLKEADYMKSVWGTQLLNDPYYNPNLTLEDEDFSLAFPPRSVKPWQHRS